MVVTDAAPSASETLEVPDPIVHVVDDDAKLGDSMRFLLETDGFDVRTHRSENAFLNEFDHEVPGCVLLDLQMETDRSGIEVLHELSRRRSRVPVIMISAHGQVRIAVDALQLGAIDFLEKPVEGHVVLRTVKAAVKRSVEAWPLHREVEQILARRATLTRRQAEVLHLVVAGLSSRRIAERLSVTEKTIEAHRQSISQKMNASNVSQLVRMVMAADPPTDLVQSESD